MIREDNIDLTGAIVICPPNLSRPEDKVVGMLVAEVEKRTGIHWQVTTEWSSTETPVLIVGQRSALEALNDDLPNSNGMNAAEGYQLLVKDARLVFVIGNDARGVLFGVGHLLRSLHMSKSKIELPGDLDIDMAPAYQLRGHQLGYRDKTNSYCAWDLEQWEQYIRDLVIFGANAIELIPPRSDDKLESVHFPLPPIDMMVGMSQLADDYGIDVWIWFPALDGDYSDPSVLEFALDERRQIYETLPRIDAVFTPGGDPGHTRPRYFMPFLEKQAELLNIFHPKAQTWVSPQGFTQEWMDEFMDILNQESPDWLTGVVHGPWVHILMDEFRAMVPGKYPIRNYPDITHTIHCQLPPPDWDIAYALTEGREPINPRPFGQAAIFRHMQPPTIGFLTYSEGCNDDVNKCIWSSLGWDPGREVIDILREYSRYFIGESYTENFAQGLLALERNWEGALISNANAYTTLQQFQRMEESASPQDLRNWRFQQALYRAYYDAYVRSRLIYETGLEEQAMDQLRQAPERGSLVAIAEAERILKLALTQPVSNNWRTRIFQLAEALFQSIHMQLSVKLYHAQEEVRGASLDGIDYPLNDRPWLLEQFANIRKIDDETERLRNIKDIVDWTNPGPGGYYDDLCNSSRCPHLVPSLSFAEDPAFLKSPVRKFPYRKDNKAIRLSWRSYTGSLRDEPFEMRYPDLDPGAQYEVRIVYSGACLDIKVRLEANDGIDVHPFILKKEPRGPMEFSIPKEATSGGELILRWYREPGYGSIGTGCDVSEVWLIRE